MRFALDGTKPRTRDQALAADANPVEMNARAMRGRAKLAAQEAKELVLFATEYDPVRGKLGGGSFHCHGGALFSDFVSWSNGLDLLAADPGAQTVTGKADDRERFKAHPCGMSR